MIHLYCVCRSADPDPPVGTIGVAGDAVRVVRVGVLAAWYSNVLERDPDKAAVVLHDTVVREALRSGTPLPFRFGAHVEDRRAAASLLTERAEDLLARLERIDGCAEIAVRVRMHAPMEVPDAGSLSPSEAAGAGASYLRAARVRIGAADSMRRSAKEAVAEVVSDLPGIVDIAAGEVVQGEADVALLVRRPALATLRARLEEACADGGAIVASTGPWPPYTFTTLRP